MEENALLVWLMRPLVEKLGKEEGIKIETLEVWYNKENERRLLEIDKDLCGGVPFFYNTKTKKYLCGQVTTKNSKTGLDKFYIRIKTRNLSTW